MDTEVTEDNTNGREWHFQADFTVNGAMYHVRFDRWTDFEIGCDHMKKFIQDQDPIETAVQGKSYNVAQNTSYGTCPKCGAPMKMSKAGRLYCSKVCWKKSP